MRELAILLFFVQPFSDSLELDCKIYNNIIGSVIYKPPYSRAGIFSNHINKRAYLRD